MHMHWKRARPAGRATSPLPFACTSEGAARPDVPTARAPLRGQWGGRAGRPAAKSRRSLETSCTARGPRALAFACTRVLSVPAARMLWIRPPVVSPCRLRLRSSTHARVYLRCLPGWPVGAAPAARRTALDGWMEVYGYGVAHQACMLATGHRPSKASDRQWMDRWGRASRVGHPASGLGYHLVLRRVVRVVGYN